MIAISAGGCKKQDSGRYFISVIPGDNPWDFVSEFGKNTHCLRVRESDTCSSSFTRCLLSQQGRDDGLKSRAVVHKRDPGIGSWGVQVLEDEVEGHVCNQFSNIRLVSLVLGSTLLGLFGFGHRFLDLWKPFAKIKQLAINRLVIYRQCLMLLGDPIKYL